MANLRIQTYILIFLSLIVLSGCKQTKYVPQGQYLLKKNEVKVNKDQKNVTASGIEEVIKPKENTTFLGMKFKLAFYNSVDSTKVAKAIQRKTNRNKKKNKKRILKAEKVNDRRILRALKKGKKDYKPKVPNLKDTLGENLPFIGWWKYKAGEPPSIYDSIAQNKSSKQILLYLKKQGYYYGSVFDYVVFDEAKRKAVVTYEVNTGKPYVIDSIFIDTENSGLKRNVSKYIKKRGNIKEGMLLNSELLDDERSNLASYLRNEAYFGFSPSLVYYKVDTNRAAMTAQLKIAFKKRRVQDPELGDSIYSISHKPYRIRKVYFHISDTSKLKESYSKLVMQNFGTSELLDENGYLYAFDTLVTPEATYYYNGKLLVKHQLLELQNFLEPNINEGDAHYYRERYVTRSYQRLMDLGVFSTVKPVLKQVGLSSLLDVHYYLVPAKKQSFSFEPRGTHSNGFLGFSASLNYKNKNLFRGAQSMLISVSGGFESQPPVFSTNGSSGERTFNTFDIGPKITFNLPGLFPFPAKMLSKRQMPNTVISVLYNYQARTDFKRHLIQFDYTWTWKSGKKQTFKGSILNPVKFTIISPSDEFQQKLDNLNDLFLRNAYSSQFTWEDIKISHVYDSQKENLQQGKTEYLYNRLVLNHAGGMTSLITLKQTPDVNGQKRIFKVPYAQFAKIENETKFHHKVGKRHDFNYRLYLGLGIPYGNSKTTMPFDYSFFAGGSNDNRGYVARTLGPGSYKYYIDVDGTQTQIGDVKIAMNVEYRVSLTDLFKLAVFVDAGNIWTLREDVNRPGSQISKNFYKELAISTGVGLRLDFNFFVIRVDFGIPLNQPSFPSGEQWIWNKKRPQWHKELEDTYGEAWGDVIKNQFVPRFNIGIGYPF